MIELISGSLESTLYNVDADTLTGIFCWLILAIALLALVCYKQDKWRSFTHYTPTLLTSLGMLGTFVGIVIGLLHFDTTDIQGSVPLLLDGLKTAFMTSLFGMSLAMFYKVLSGLGWMQPANDVASGPDEIGPEHIHQLLDQQNGNLEKLLHAIAGDESDTLVSRIRLMDQKQQENFNTLTLQSSRQAKAAEDLVDQAGAQRKRFDEFSHELERQLRDFAEMMSKSATEQLIEALNQVIKDFNERLTEQFGKNFEELNDAVKAMVEWQDNYRQQLGEMRDQYAQGVTAITETEQSVAHISDKASAIPETMEGLSTLLATAQRQLADLEGHLGAFAEMRDKAVEAVPEVSRQVQQTVNEITTASQQAAKDLVEGSARVNRELLDGAEGINDRYNRVHESLQSTSDQMARHSEEIAQQFRDAHEDVNGKVRELIEQITSQTRDLTGTLSDANQETHQQLTQLQRKNAEALEGLQSEHQRALSEATQHYQHQLSSIQQQFQSALRESMQDTSKSLSAHIEALDDSLRQELEQVMSHMGGALVQISDRFTNDYQKLTNEMHRVVNSANAGSYS